MEWNYKIQSNYVVFVFTKFSISFNEISEIKEQISSNEFSTCHIRLDKNFYYYWCFFEKYEEMQWLKTFDVVFVFTKSIWNFISKIYRSNIF